VWWLVSLIACGVSEPPNAPAPPEPQTSAPRAVVSAPLPPAPAGGRYAASHILVMWDGAAGAVAVGRTEPEARQLADQLHGRASQGEPFEALARAHSEGPSAARGGRLGVYETGTMVPDFEAAVASVKVGSVAPLVRTPFGFHVVRRDRVRVARAAHLVIPWDGAWRSTATRTRSEALEVCEEALAQLRAGAQFAAVARQFGEDETAPLGGDLGEVAEGQLLPAVEQALFALKPGQTSEAVESPWGWHVVRRLE
jgi:peptidyl-prolyl cis-trans isomerase SurA